MQKRFGFYSMKSFNDLALFSFVIIVGTLSTLTAKKLSEISKFSSFSENLRYQKITKRWSEEIEFDDFYFISCLIIYSRFWTSVEIQVILLIVILIEILSIRKHIEGSTTYKVFIVVDFIKLFSAILASGLLLTSTEVKNHLMTFSFLSFFK